MEVANKFDIKKFLPLILLGFSVLVLVFVIIFVKNSKKEVVTEDETKLAEIDFKDRPFASLTPTADGHYITLNLRKLTLPKLASVDYELLYSLPDGRTQGVPGTVDLSGQTSFEKKLLLGSESNGKFRYDEGVVDGSLTVRLRDSKGKLMAKFATKWHLQSDTQELTSIDENFKYTLEKKPKGVYFITMETFGLPEGSTVNQVSSGPYGVFASEELPAGAAEGFQTTSNNLFYK